MQYNHNTAIQITDSTLICASLPKNNNSCYYNNMMSAHANIIIMIIVSLTGVQCVTLGTGYERVTRQKVTLHNGKSYFF